jgi:uncharacterized repeat protein (TIGR01451 family)
MKTIPIPRYAGLRLAAITLTSIALVAQQAPAAILTNVVETGGDNEATDTITAKWTGVTWNTTIANEPTLNTPVGTPFTVPAFGEDVPAMVDRAHQWNGISAAKPIPNYLLGGEYIMIGNDNRDNVPFQLDLYVAQRCVVFVLIDYRRGDAAQGGTESNGDPPFLGVPLDQWIAMTWVSAGGFQPLSTGWNRSGNLSYPDEVAYDEGGDGTGPGNGLNQYAGIYYRIVDPGASGTPAVSTYEFGQGANMYGVVVTPVAPVVPRNVQAASMNGRVILSWTASPGATNYIVRRSDVSGGPYTDIGTAITGTFTDSTAINGQTYYYVVAAEGLFGISQNSTQVVGAPKLAPESLVARGGTNQITLSWAPMTGAASYTVKRADSAGGPFSNLATGYADTTYVDSGLADGRRYYYTVSAALSGGGESANADEAMAFTAPNIPASFVAERFATTVIRLSWVIADQVPATTTTLVERSSDGTTFTPLAAVTNGATRYFHTNLPASLTNYYRLRGTNSGGYSSYTAVQSASTPAGGVNVNFGDSAITGAAGYPIPGYLDDFGLLFGDQGNGYSYGWDEDNSANDRLRNAANSPDLRYDTFNHLQKTTPGRIWQITIPNGLYFVHIVSGDATATDSVFQFDVESYVSTALTPAANDWWKEFNLTVRVQDGQLTLTSGPNASNNKICFVDIYPTVPTPNVIATHPVSQTVTQNQSVTFSATVAGGPEPYGFQWYKGGTPIPGQNGSTYSIPFAQLADQGDYSVTVTNAGASVSSEIANLTVIQDTWPPVALSAGTVDGSMIGIQFDEYMDVAVASEFSHYQVNGSGANISFVYLTPDQRTVYLYMATPVTGNFTVTLTNLKDMAGNILANATLNGVHMGLTLADLGSPSISGSSLTWDGSTVEMVGGGSDIWNAADQCQYAYKTVSDDFDARVRVISLTQANVWSKAGLMMRETLDPGSRNIMLLTTPLPLNNVYQMQWRDTFGGACGAAPTTGPVSYPNAWIRLIRSGNTFTSMIQTNGADWVTLYTYTPAYSNYPSQVYLGLAVTAHDDTLTATSILSSFTVSAPAADVALTKTATADVVETGGTISYTITALNQGVASAGSVVVTDPLPAGVSYVSSVASAGTASHSAGTVTWTVGDLGVGQSATLTLTATAGSVGSKTNTAAVTAAGEQNPANNTASATVIVSAAPTVGGPSIIGGKFTFTVPTEPGVNYVVEYTSNLVGTWATLTTFAGTGSPVLVEDPAPITGSRYYRVRLAAP